MTGPPPNLQAKGAEGEAHWKPNNSQLFYNVLRVTKSTVE